MNSAEDFFSFRDHGWQSNKIKSSLYSPHYAEACNELRGPSPRLSAWGTLLQRNVVTVASRWRHCVDLTGTGIEPQTSLTDSERFATELTAGFMDGSDFQKISSTVQNWNKKRGENLLFWRSHSYVNRDLQKKKVFTLFSNQRAARGFNSFSKSGPSCEIIAHPCIIVRTFQLFVPLSTLGQVQAS